MALNQLTKIIGISMVVLSTSACSTIVNGSNQSIAFNTGDVEGANCELTGGSEFAVRENFTTPAAIQVPRSKKALQMECTKAGYKDAKRSINSKVEATMGGNLLIGGVVGGAVDAATGAMYKYPETVSLPMEKANSDDGSADTGEPIAD